MRGTTINSELIETIFAISKLMKGRMSYNSQLMKLTMVQMQTLIFLKQHKSAHMREIAQFFKIELPSATSLLNKLHGVGLVERQHDEYDRRIVRIVLTQKGEQLLQQAMDERTKKINTLLSHLSKEDKKQLQRILQTIVSKLELYEK